MKSIAVVGFGRFGELFAELAKDQYEVAIYEHDEGRRKDALSLGYDAISLDALSSMDVVVLAMPISAVEDALREIAPNIMENQLVFDVCSVKVHPSRQMQKYLPHCETIATHPMFGPDSAARGLKDLRVALCPLRASKEAIQFVKTFWEDRGVEIVETTPEVHDRDAAYSQAMPYVIAHALNNMELPELTFPTVSSKALYDIAHYSAKDSEQLFRDMLAYNPYVPDMLEKFVPSMTRMLDFATSVSESNSSGY